MRVGLSVLLILLVISCKSNEMVQPETDIKVSTAQNNEFTNISVEVLKWFGGKKSAISLTYDVQWCANTHNYLTRTVNDVYERGLRMDIEFVTSNFTSEESQYYIDYIKSEILPLGIKFFGHGHEHINHDELDYYESLKSFLMCNSLMKSWGLASSVYAYPGARGYKFSTQKACLDAGYFCARGVEWDPDKYFICANDKKLPDNWMYLPSVPVGTEDPIYIENHDEMHSVFKQNEEYESWIILMLHSIGINPGWAYYPYKEFIKDLDWIKNNDVWCGNYEDVAKYIKERNNFNFEMESTYDEVGSLVYKFVFSDQLPNYQFDFPLTLKICFNQFTNKVKILFPKENKEEIVNIENGVLIYNFLPNEEEVLITNIN